MRLRDIEFIKLLPQFMREDKANTGLSGGVNEVVQRLEATIGTLSTWDSIDNLSEKELDELAWELNIDWYQESASINIKCQLIKDSERMSRKLGTKWAVERIINTYFGDGYIVEWFEYEGDPGHFKVFSANPTVTNENLKEFLNILDKVKRASSHLDGITISLTGQMKLHAGVAYHEASFETIRLGKAPS